MQIENNILRYYLRNVYFITGTAYAGKSTAARMLAERYGLILCGENYFSAVSDKVAELISLSQQHKVIADTNIPLDLLHEISDAQLLTPNFSLLSAKNFLLPPFSFLHKLLTPIYTMCGLLFRR